MQAPVGTDLRHRGPVGQGEVLIGLGEGPALLVDLHVHPVEAEQVVELLVGAGDHLHHRLGALLGKGRDGLVQLPAGVVAGKAHPQHPLPPVRPALGLLHNVLQPALPGLGLAVKVIPRRGEGEAPALAQQQGQAQLLLQGLHLLGDGRLGDKAGLRRLGEAPLVHHFDVITDLPQFHRKAPFLLYQHSTPRGRRQGIYKQNL